MRYQFFFDESGKSNLADASSSKQPHLILAGVLVPWDSPFWQQVERAWTHAAALLGVAPEKVELHGTDVYGGKGPWMGVSNRREVLDIVVRALKNNDIRIYWTGLPIDALKVIEKNAWRRVLTIYLQLLSERLHHDLAGTTVEIHGDANEWIGPDHALVNNGWVSFSAQRAEFHNSKGVYGIQVADIVAHTLYRSNKVKKSETDLQAEEYRVMLAQNFVHLPSAR